MYEGGVHVYVPRQLIARTQPSWKCAVPSPGCYSAIAVLGSNHSTRGQDSNTHSAVGVGVACPAPWVTQSDSRCAASHSPCGQGAHAVLAFLVGDARELWPRPGLFWRLYLCTGFYLFYESMVFYLFCEPLTLWTGGARCSLPSCPCSARKAWRGC